MGNVISFDRKKLRDAVDDARALAARVDPEAGPIPTVILPMSVVVAGAPYATRIHPAHNENWTASRSLAWAVGVLKALSGVTAVVTWTPAGADQWTVQMRGDSRPIEGLTYARVWDVLAGAIEASMAIHAAQVSR